MTRPFNPSPLALCIPPRPPSINFVEPHNFHRRYKEKSENNLNRKDQDCHKSTKEIKLVIVSLPPLLLKQHRSLTVAPGVLYGYVRSSGNDETTGIQVRLCFYCSRGEMCTEVGGAYWPFHVRYSLCPPARSLSPDVRHVILFTVHLNNLLRASLVAQGYCVCHPDRKEDKLWCHRTTPDFPRDIHLLTGLELVTQLFTGLG